jgi:hypothetical protein
MQQYIMPSIHSSSVTSFNRRVRALIETVFLDRRFAWFENRLHDINRGYANSVLTEFYGLFKPSVGLIELADILAESKQHHAEQ